MGSTCQTGKVCIQSADVARATAHKVARASCRAANHYRCRHCGQWHVGSVVKSGAGGGLSRMQSAKSRDARRSGRMERGLDGGDE